MNTQALEVYRRLLDPAGTDRLSLVWVRVEGGSDFHSLSWERRTTTNTWAPYIVITQEQFEANTLASRWVSDVHSFDPVAGTAIVRVAEGDKPEGAYPVNYLYSWRSWDLRNNREERFLYSCDKPTDPFLEEWDRG